MHKKEVKKKESPYCGARYKKSSFGDLQEIDDQMSPNPMGFTYGYIKTAEHTVGLAVSPSRIIKARTNMEKNWNWEFLGLTIQCNIRKFCKLKQK